VSHSAPTPGGARLSIGALSRATGIPVETLRTWELRYGFPVPERKPSGHRVYPVATVARLRRMALALARGHRAGEVVGASEEDLGELMKNAGRESVPTESPSAPGALELPELLEAVKTFDSLRLMRILLADWARLSPVDFVEQRIGPLVAAVGVAWEEGRLLVSHEHFLSERVTDLLRSLRLPFEERARGPLVILATLPGEPHGLGLQMAALLVAWAGCRTLLLGTEMPVTQVASLARDSGAAAVALSLSLATRGARSNGQIRSLRQRLPRRVEILVGGAGAPETRAGVENVADARRLEDWARRQSSA
jgi:MerR family transcriptional regulator, light-induced transcriptional regulator